MPPKTKRRIHLEKARASKRTREGESETEGDISAAEPSTSTIQEPSENPTLEEDDVKADEEYDEMSAIHIHATEWVESLSRDDLLSLAILLWYLLTGILAMQITEEDNWKSNRKIRSYSQGMENKF